MKSKRIYLTPKILKRIDTLARIEAGCPVVVFDRSIKKPWGFVNAQCTSFYNVPVKDMEKKGRRFALNEGQTHVACDLQCIEIANSILINGEPCQRAIDWNAVPTDKIYDFLVWHEIAHVIHCDTTTTMKMAFSSNSNYHTTSEEKRSLVKIAKEIRADVWAWNKMFPRLDVPTTGAMKQSEIARCQAALEEYEQEHQINQISPISISTNHDEYVFFKYREEGIPWVGPAKALARRQSGY